MTVAREQLLEMEIRDRENEELLSQVQQKQQQRRAAAAATAGNGRRERSSASTSNYECSSSSDKAAGNVELAGDCCPNHRRLCTDLESRLTFAVNKSARLEQMLTESKQRCKQMQNELDTSEAVQKGRHNIISVFDFLQLTLDFVRLSQQLQIELEKIRQSEVEVILVFSVLYFIFFQFRFDGKKLRMSANAMDVIKNSLTKIKYHRKMESSRIAQIANIVERLSLTKF